MSVPVLYLYPKDMKKRKWSNEILAMRVKESYSLRQVIKKLGLIPAGGNYLHVQRIIKELGIDTSHFLGKGWSLGLKLQFKPRISLESILTENNNYQSYKLKRRLFDLGIKKQKCELCGWDQKSKDGRIPVELDHINGNHLDHRFENLRILCPNCHSLQPTHRGINKVKYKKS